MLKDLQALDFELKELQQHLERIPNQISGFELNLDENQNVVDQARKMLEDQRQAQRHTENEVAALLEQLSKYKTQLMEVKTNKEYQAVLREIETIEQQIGKKEDQILELMLVAEGRLGEANALEKECRQKNAEILRKKTEVQSFLSKTEIQIVEVDGKRKSLVGVIPASLVARYQRISTARGGHVLAQIVDGFCQGCNVVLRPQLIAEVKTVTRIATCEACNRILYHDED